MDFKDLVIERYSCREFSKKVVGDKEIDYILQCARRAPSAHNFQPWKIYIVKDKTVLEKLYESYPGEWLKSANMIAVFAGLTDESWKRADGADYIMCDVTIIADYFIHAATELGLDTCWVAAFDEKKVIEALHLPGNEKPFILTPLGYAVKKVSRETKRKDISEIYKII
jgi:nitroreductase